MRQKKTDSSQKTWAKGLSSKHHVNQTETGGAGGGKGFLSEERREGVDKETARVGEIKTQRQQ